MRLKKINHSKSISLLIGFIIFSSLVIGLYNDNEDTINTLIFDQSNTRNLSTSKQPKSSSIEVPIIYGDVPSAGYINTQNAYKILQEELLNNHYNNSRTGTIVGTFWVTQSLFHLGSEYLSSHSLKIRDYIMSKYNNDIEIFQDTIDFEYISNRNYMGDDIHKKLLTPEIIHSMAIITLDLVGYLTSSFSTSIRQIWKSQLMGLMNSDGGFGTAYGDNSTIHETLYILWALHILEGNSPAFLSPIQKENLQSFIESKQYIQSDIEALNGVFREYTTGSEYTGWEDFEASLQALQIGELMALDLSNIGQNFGSFISTNELFNTQTNHFIRSWYNKYSNKVHPLGTAVTAEALRIAGGVIDFENEISTALEHFSTRYSREGISEGLNWFYRSEEPWNYELVDQARILTFLRNTGNIDQVLDTQLAKSGIFEYLESFFTRDGGASLYSNYYPVPQNIYDKWITIPPNELSSAQMEELYSEIFQFYFNFYSGIAFMDIQLRKEQYFFDHQAEGLNIIDNAYFLISLLDKFDLYERLYLDIGLDWLTLEQTFIEQYAGDGFFFGNFQKGYGQDSLKTTYRALSALDMLFAYNTGQTFSNYFTLTQIEEIKNFTLSFIEEDELKWGSPGGNDEALKNTFLCQRILEILHIPIPTQKIHNWLEEYLSLGFSENMDYNINLLHLAKHNEIPDSLIVQWIKNNISQIHQCVATTLVECSSTQHYNHNLIEKLKILHDIDIVIVKCHIPKLLQPYFQATLSFNILTITSLLSDANFANINLYDDTQTFSQYSGTQDVSILVIPTHSDLHPLYWYPTLSFDIEDKSHTCTISVQFSSTLFMTSKLFAEDEGIRINFYVEISPEIFLTTDYSIDLYSLDEYNHKTYNFTVNNNSISVTNENEIYNISGYIPYIDFSSKQCNYSAILEFEGGLIPTREHFFILNRTIHEQEENETITNEPISEENEDDSQKNTSDSTVRSHYDSEIPQNNKSFLIFSLSGACISGTSFFKYRHDKRKQNSS